MIRLTAFGTWSLQRRNGTEVLDLQLQPSSMAVLAYLAIARPRGWFQRDQLLGMLWPDLDAEHARGALRKSLHRIRSALGDEIVITQGPDTLQLSREHFQCDVNDFDESFVNERLRECLDWYGGELLPGFYGSHSDSFERWLTTEREHYQQRAVTAALKLLDFYEAHREFTSATHLARVVARLASTDERVLRRVISLMVRLGDRAGAVAVYRKFSDQLWRAYNAHPSAETVALMDGIVRTVT